MMQCSKRAYAMCPDRHFCGPIEAATFADDSECAAFNAAVEDKPMTNADRIRAMDDEELGHFLMQAMPCEVIRCPDSCYDCFACTMRWLHQPAEGGANEP